MKQIFAILGVFFLLTAFSLNHAPEAADGNTLPAINVKTMDGKSVNIQELVGKGKITVISFWATWCSPCKRELDAIAEIYPDWQEEYGVELLAVTIDDARGVAKVPAMVASKGWEYEILSDSKQDLQRALNFQTVPQTFLLDGSGEIVYSHSGYTSGDEYELEEQIIKAAGK
ncbi:MAG: TlpA disulfide reductase family protein [Bacteroidota bacterium]